MCQEISLPVPLSSFSFTDFHYSLQEIWNKETMVNEELFRSPTNSKNSGHKPGVVIEGGSRTETLFSPRFRSVAEMAGWDEEALLIASLIVEDTPERHTKQKKRPDLPNFKTPPSNSRRCFQFHATTFKKQIQILAFSVKFLGYFYSICSCNIWVFAGNAGLKGGVLFPPCQLLFLTLTMMYQRKKVGFSLQQFLDWHCFFGLFSNLNFIFSLMVFRDQEEFARTQNYRRKWTEENWQGWIRCSEIEWFLLEFLHSVYGSPSWGAFLRCKSFSIHSTYSSRSPDWIIKPLFQFHSSNIRSSLILTDMFGDLFRTQHYFLWT